MNTDCIVIENEEDALLLRKIVAIQEQLKKIQEKMAISVQDIYSSSSILDVFRKYIQQLQGNVQIARDILQNTEAQLEQYAEQFYQIQIFINNIEFEIKKIRNLGGFPASVNVKKLHNYHIVQMLIGLQVRAKIFESLVPYINIDVPSFHFDLTTILPKELVLLRDPSQTPGSILEKELPKAI